MYYNMKNYKLLIGTFFALLLLGGCQPVYKEFQPEHSSLFQITFTYPSKWTWEEAIPFDDIRPGDYVPPSELIFSTDSYIYIQVYKPSNPRELMQEWLRGTLSNESFFPPIVTHLIIDGYDAVWITRTLPASGNATESSTSEVIYLLTGDRFYIISYNFHESSKDDKIIKAFEELVYSIRILD
jgi:hypothetical protein